MASNQYRPNEIEARWQGAWERDKTFRVLNPGDDGFDPSKPKYYVLDMFPYPSGAGLHVGHPMGYIGSDIVARRKRMEGFNVLHPMGYDAFGLPAEQYAIATGRHPEGTVSSPRATSTTTAGRSGSSAGSTTGDWPTRARFRSGGARSSRPSSPTKR